MKKVIISVLLAVAVFATVVWQNPTVAMPYAAEDGKPPSTPTPVGPGGESIICGPAGANSYYTEMQRQELSKMYHRNLHQD